MCQSPFNHKVKFLKDSWSNSSIALFQRYVEKWSLEDFPKTSASRAKPGSMANQSTATNLPPEAVLSLSYTCGICEMQCSNQAGLQNHIYRSHKKSDSKMFKCDQCNRSYMSLSKLKRHQREDHMGIYKHTCPICKKGFSNRGGLQGHLVTHGAQAEFHCDVCQKPFAYKQPLKQHMIKEHGFVMWLR